MKGHYKVLHYCLPICACPHPTAGRLLLSGAAGLVGTASPTEAFSTCIAGQLRPGSGFSIQSWALLFFSIFALIPPFSLALEYLLVLH